MEEGIGIGEGFPFKKNFILKKKKPPSQLDFEIIFRFFKHLEYYNFKVKFISFSEKLGEFSAVQK